MCLILTLFFSLFNSSGFNNLNSPEFKTISQYYNHHHLSQSENFSKAVIPHGDTLFISFELAKELSSSDWDELGNKFTLVISDSLRYPRLEAGKPDEESSFFLVSADGKRVPFESDSSLTYPIIISVSLVSTLILFFSWRF